MESLGSVVPANLRIERSSLTIDHTLGKGGSGVVFKGLWDRWGNGEAIPVAIKMISEITALEMEEVRREFSIMSSYSHKHLCKVYGGCIISNSELWLVMELFDGGNLRECLDMFRLSFKGQLTLAIQATSALHFLHQHNVLHRDVKSLNFLCNKRLKFLVLTDLGLAKERDRLTSKTSTLGTARWAAPEVQGKRKKWTEKADVFSLGMVFYELASGQIPFTEYTTERASKEIKSGHKPSLPTTCNKYFAKIIARCWKKDPRKRPSTAELLVWLEAMQDHGQLPESFKQCSSCSVQ